MSFYPGPSNFPARMNPSYMYTPQTQYYMPTNNVRNNINAYPNIDIAGLLRSATGEMLLQAGNQAYIQLQREILILRNQCLSAQLTQRISDNNTTINTKLDAFNDILGPQDERLYLESIPGSAPKYIPYTNDPAQTIMKRNAFLKSVFPLAHTRENVILRQQDYPAVRFWTAEPFRSWLSQQPRGEIRVRRDEISKKNHFLEDKNGNLLPYSTILSIRQYLRDVFAKVKYYMPELLAPSCGKVDQALLNVICHELRIMHPELALCSQDWKVLDLLSRWYSHWNNPGSGEDEDNFSENDEDEQEGGSSTRLNGDASSTNGSLATKHGLPGGTANTAFKKAKIENHEEKPLQAMHAAQEATVKFENTYHGTLSDTTNRVPKRRREPGSRRQKVTTSLEPRNLCAKDWKILHPNGTTNEFRQYWSSIGAVGQAKWTKISVELKAKQTPS